jgi:hypothetical protein
MFGVNPVRPEVIRHNADALTFFNWSLVRNRTLIARSHSGAAP